MSDCLFCAIANKEHASPMLFEDNESFVIRDINPKAPTHLLIIPRRHIASLAVTSDDDASLLGRLLVRAKKMAEQEGIEKTGYKIVINTGRHGGQVIDHLHVHLLGGEPITTLV